MRNVTIAIPDATYAKARVFAANHDLSLSGVVTGLLERLDLYENRNYLPEKAFMEHDLALRREAAERQARIAAKAPQPAPTRLPNPDKMSAKDAREIAKALLSVIAPDTSSVTGLSALKL